MCHLQCMVYTKKKTKKKIRKTPELAILISLVLAKNLIDAVHECTFF